MSLNDINLPVLVLSELYGKDLLIREATSDAADGGVQRSLDTAAKADVARPEYQVATQSSDTYRSLGSNKRKIAILVKTPGTPFLPDEQLAFLTKMLEACKLNIGDVAIVNHASAPVAIPLLKKQLSPAIVLLFGVEPVDIQLPLHFPEFKVQAYDHCTYLSAPALDKLGQTTEEGKLLKSKLWHCLKDLFQL